MIDQLSAEDFENLPANSLAQQRGTGSVTLEIVEVIRLRPSSVREKAFALILRENGVRSWEPQGTFVYEHPKHGELPLFTVPIGPDAQGMRYEVTFN